MPLPVSDPTTLPANVLFPEDYRRSSRMIVQDFALLGSTIVAFVLGVALLPLAF